VHLLLALLDQGDGIAGPLLNAVGADPAQVHPLAFRQIGEQRFAPRATRWRGDA